MGSYVLESNLNAKGYTLDDLASWIGVTKQTAKEKIRGLSLFKPEEIEIISQNLNLTQKEKEAIFVSEKQAKERKNSLKLSSQLKNLGDPSDFPKIEEKPDENERIRRGNFLKQKIKEHGDTQITLAKELGISRPALGYKIAERVYGNVNYSFTASEMAVISKRYSFTPDEFKEAFLGGHPEAIIVLEKFEENVESLPQNDSEDDSTLFYLNSKGVVIENATTHEKKEFRSVTEAANKMGFCKVALTQRLGESVKKKTIADNFGDVWIVNYADNQEKILILTNVKTGESVEFGSVKDAANHVGVSTSGIYHRLRNPDENNPVTGDDGKRWNVKYGFKNTADERGK